MTDLLGERHADWLTAVAHRHSRRIFDGVPVDAGTLDALASACAGFRPYDDARVELVRDPEVDVFTGAVGSYGKVRHAPHVLLFIGDESGGFCDQHVGYTAEAIVLEATALGLETCWIGGFFDRAKTSRLAALSTSERVLAVSPVGHAAEKLTLTERSMQAMAGAHTRKSADEIAPGCALGAWPEWAVAAVEAARLAPSAVNRQPWRFACEDGALLIARDNGLETPRVSKRLDCGIAMLHAELGARACGVKGTWHDLAESLAVARFATDGAAV